MPAGFLSERQWGAIDKACGEDFALPGNPTYTAACQALLTQASATAGKFYVYDVYDTCGADQMKSKATGTLDELVRAPLKALPSSIWCCLLPVATASNRENAPVRVLHAFVVWCTRVGRT